MNYIDIVLGVVIVFGIVRGFMKGLFLEIAALVGLIAGIYGAIHFSYYAGDFLSEQFTTWDEKYVNLAAFIITFIVILILVTLIGRLLTKIADFAALGMLNKLLGGAFGGLKMAIIAGAVLIFFDRTNNTMEFVSEEKVAESVLYEPVKELGAYVFTYVLEGTSSPEVEELSEEKLHSEEQQQANDLQEIEEEIQENNNN